MSDSDETCRLVDEGLATLRHCLDAKNYASVGEVWDEVWFAVRFISPEVRAELRQRFGGEVNRLVDALRLHIKQKRVRGDIASRLEAVKAKIGLHK